MVTALLFFSLGAFYSGVLLIIGMRWFRPARPAAAPAPVVPEPDMIGAIFLQEWEGEIQSVRIQPTPECEQWLESQKVA